MDIKIPKPPNIRFPKIIGCAVLDFFGSGREILQVTVSLDHPVSCDTGGNELAALVALIKEQPFHCFVKIILIYHFLKLENVFVQIAQCEIGGGKGERVR